MTRVAIYCRISLDQTGQALGVTRQEQDDRELAEQLGWEIHEIYVDNDVSATTGKVRPAYRRMLDDAAAGKVQAIIAWHPDRLYRVLPDLGELVEVCKRHNIQIATVKAGAMDLTTPTGRLVAGLLAQVATYEGEAKVDRYKRRIRQNREGGAFSPSGPRMFGYTRDGQIVPDEAETVRWIAEQVTTGHSLNSIIRDLNDRGLTTSTGKPWQTQGMKRMITNPKLAAYVALNGDILGDGDWEPILERDTWESVRAVLAANRSQPTRPRIALLPGLIWCGKCEARMVTGSRMNKRKAMVRTYRCTRVPGVESCMAVSAVAAPVEEVVEGYARERWKDPRVLQRQAELRGQSPALLAEVGDLEGRLVELEQQLDQPGVPVEVLLRARARAAERLEELQRQLASTPAVRYQPGGAWPTDLASRRALVEAVVAQVWLDPATEASDKFDPRRVRISRRD